MIFNKNDYDSKQRFSIRKLSVGVCSVLLSTLFLTMNDNQTVHAATEPAQQETETSENVEASASRGSNVGNQYASKSATTTEMPSKSTQSEDSTTETTHPETSRKETPQTKTSGTETAQKSDEGKEDNVENTPATTQDNNQQSTTAKPVETSSTVQNSETSKPDSSTTQTKNETNSLTQTTPVENTTQKTNTFNVSNFSADKANINALQEIKTAATATTPTTNGGYDSATWGTLDTSKWTGQSAGFDGNNYYQLTGYTGDQTHIIVPNQADFEQAGKSTNNLQVSISNDLIKRWQKAATIAFSKTEDKKVKLASNNLNNTFQNDTNLTSLDANSLDTSSATSMQSTFEGTTKLSSLNGISDWDVSNVTNMSLLFQNATGLTSLTGLENWDVQKVTNMTRIFNNVNKVTKLSPLSNWKTDSLQKLNTAFANNSFTNLQGLENWNVSHVTDLGVIFMSDANLTDISALAKWDTSNVTDLNRAFNVNQALTSLHGLENWNTSKVTNLEATFANEGSLVDASAIANWNTSNVTNMSVLFAGSNAQYVDLSNWDFSKVTSASNVINNTQSVVYLGNNSTLTADKLNTLGIANGGFTQPIILASGSLYTLLSNKNNNTHNITINNASGSHLTTISVPVVYDAAGASNMTDAINSYKDMVDQKLEDYVTEHNYVLKRVSTAPVDDVTGHNNHLVNYANATYQVVTIPADQKKNLQIQDKTTYKGKTLTAKDLVTNVADFPSGTTFEFADNSEPNWDQVGTYNVKVIATYPVSVNGQQYTAVTAPATAKVTVTQQMQFTITYWDDTENKEIIQFDIKNAGNGGYSNDLKFPDGVNPAKYQSVSVSGVPAGATVAGDQWRSFTDPSCNWTIPNYKWTTEAAPSFYGANVVVHLVHKTQDVTNTDPAAQETRTVTVNYVKTKVNEDGTYTEDGNAFTSAVLDVYYIRQATKDLVTGTVTYGPWQWNTKKGDSNTPGYHVVSGTWTNLPQKWATVTADVPTLDGYTAYTGGPATNTSKVPANQFVFPTWNGSDGDTSDISKGSTAYTTAASLYEAQPVHTIFYVPNKTEARTITAKFVYAGGDKNGQSVAPDAQIQVFFKQAGTINASTNKVVYGDWTWDKTVGDEDNLGFRVISGNWNIAQDGQFTVTPPDAGNDYVVANLNSTGTYTTVNFANPNYNSNTVFTTNNASQWYVRNELTTYYVPKSLTQKTINRVINFTPVNQPGTPSVTQTTTQSATITRPVRVNTDDSGVVFDGFDGSGWTTGEWDRYKNMPVPDNYTKVIKQIVTHPDGTTTETTLNIPNWRPIPAQTVTIDTLPTVINITYTATATAFLAGTNESTYTGSPITLDDLNNGDGDNPIYAGVGGPTGAPYTLQAGDVEFSSDNGQTWTTEMPTNAGTYELRWSEHGKQNIIKEFGNNSIKWVDAQGNSTFTSTATYIINPAPATFTLSNQTSGNYSKIYDAQPATSIDPSKLTITANFNNAKVVLDTTGLTSDSYEWVDVQGNPISNPENVGTYYIKLKDAALSTLEKDNPNFTLTNGGGLATYTITQAQASGVLSGSNSRTYDGQATTTAEVNSNGQIGVTVTFPGVTDANKTYILKDGDYKWSSGSAPTNAGSYTITLTPDGISNLEKYILGLAGSGQNNTPNVVFSDNAFTGSASYTINVAENTVSVDGTQTETYTGQPISVKYNANGNNSIQVSISSKDGATASLSNVQLDSGDFQIVDVSGKPITATNAGGVYHIVLTDAGANKIQQAVGDNYKISQGPSFGTLVINKAQASVEFSGNPSYTYTGSPNSDYLNGFSIKLNEPNNPTYNLVAGDIEFNVDGTWTTAVPINVGKYEVRLSQTGWDHIKEINSDNVTWSATASSGTGTYTITPASANTELSGHNLMVYNGNSVTTADLYTDGSTIKVAISGNNIVNLPTSFTLADGDYTWNTPDGKAPVNAGPYTLTLSSAGLDKIQAAIDEAVGKGNVILSKDNTGSATFQIEQAVSPNVQLDGSEKSEYNGQAVSFDPNNEETKKNFGFNNVQGLTIPDLTADDFEWVDQDGKPIAAPTDAGYYYLQLNEKGKSAFANANPNYSFATGAIGGEYTYDISQANAVITLSNTSDQTVTWTGNPATIDPANFIPEITTDNPNEKTIALPSTLQLTASDYEFLQNGKVISAPSEVGTYQVRLTEAGWQKVQKAIAGNTNYTWNYQGEGNYHIEKATANVTLDGSASTIYTGNSVVIPATAGVVNGINVKLSNGQTYVLKPEDLEFVNDQGNQIPAPTDAGTYKVRLTKAALDQIRNLESNHYNYTYNNDVVDFTIEKANADVTTSGSYDVVYNGQTPEINVDKITNAIATNNGVKLTSPTLTADDYEWVDETGKVITDPVNVGTYYLKLKDSSQSKIANNSNYIWNFKGLASVTISKANATIGFNGNQETSYTGSVITVDPDKFEVKLSNGQTYQLTDKDIQVIGNPINVGTYKVELSQAGIDAIKAADSNYNYSYDGSQGVLVIVPAKASATISGSQTTQDLELDPHNYSVVLTLNGQQQTITGLTASDFVFSKDGHPAQLTEAGTYDVELSGDAINKIRQENPNYNIDFSSTATFTLENSSQTINYVDADNKVISSTDIKGHLKGTKLSFTPEIPVGWVASDPSDVPTEITINNGTTIIKIKHGVTNVDHNNPVPDDAKTVTGEVIDGAHETDLNQTITRTINVTNPDGTKSTEVQTAKIYRNASYDNVTGEVTYGEWSTGSWKEFSPAEIKGYTASEKVVPAVEVKNGQQDETIDITYAANEQSGIISYQDEAGNEISTTSLSGKTGETVTVTPEVPAGWELVPGQDIPKTVTATAEGIPTVVIKIEHGITKVDHNNPVLDGEKTVTGKVINGAHANDLNQTITRTINVTNPDGIKSTEVQTAKIYRDASYDNVTGEVTYGEWSTANWSEFTPEKIDGYTPSEAVVPAVEVKDGQKNVTVDITYTANKQSTNIIYQDNTGQVIKTDKVNGETDQTVDVHSTVPAGWKLVNGYTIPSTITFGPDGHKDIVVQVEHATITITPDTPEDQIPNGKVPGDPDKTYPKMEKLVSEPTRIIVVTKPDGTKETVTQKVKFTRVATFDEVTGEVTYSDWKSTDSAVWEAYTPATIDGYTPNIAQVAQEAVGADTANVTVNISYTKNIVPPVEETQTIEYQDKDGKIIAREAITGEKGREMPFTPHIPENWQASGEVPKTITIGENSNKTIIRIEPKIETTELTKTVTRTIIEYLPNGDKKVVQKVTLTGTQSKNLVTGEVQTQWNSGKFDAYTPEKVAGYAASPNMVGEEVVNATTENSTIEITYVKDKVQASQVVQLVDSKGQVIASTTVVGKLGQEVTYNLPLPTNWEYTNGKPADQVKVENGITKIAIQHKTEEVTDTHTVTETIHFKYADQSQALPDTIQTITFIRNGVKDLVTGETIWGKWDKESSTFPEIVAPNISGYSPNPMTINAQTVGPNSQNLEFTVTYSPINKPNDDNNKPTPNPDNPVNPSKPDNNKPNKPDHNKPIEPNKPNKKPAKPVQPNKKPANKVPTKPVTPTIHKPSTKRSDNKPLYEEKDFPRGSHKLDNGTIVDSHGRVLYKNGKLTRLGRAMLKKGHEKVLPQTGQKDSENISWIGALLAGLGIFGLADRKKRKKKN